MKLVRLKVLWSLALFFLLTVRVTASEEYPKVLFGNPENIKWIDGDWLVDSESPLLQIQMSEDLVLSMGKGVQVQIDHSGGKDNQYVLVVRHGFVQFVSLRADRIYQLKEGHYPIALSGSGLNDIVRTSTLNRVELGVTQGIQLGELELTKQDQYLESLRINVTVINDVVIGVINGLFPR